MNIFVSEWDFKVGEIVYEKESYLGPRMQQDLQLVYLFRGDLSVSIDGRNFQMEPGEAILLLPGSMERFTFATGGATRHGWCTATNVNFDAEPLRAHFLQPECIVFTDTMQATALRALSLKHAADSTQSAYRDTLIQSLFYEYLSRTHALNPKRKAHGHPAVERACSYMATHFDEPLTLPQIASHAGLTPAHLTRLFRQMHQTTPIRYLWRLRLKRAAELLLETGLTVAEVSDRCGFSNPQHFAKLFKATYTMTPGQHRTSQWSKTGG